MSVPRSDGCSKTREVGAAGRSSFGEKPGIGKSALLGWALECAQKMRILRARGIESEAELAFSGLLELSRPILNRLGELPARQALALRTAFALEPAQVVDRFAISAATLSLIGMAAEETPLLIVVDDAHWLDSASADALVFTARRLEADRVAVIFAVREGEALFPQAASRSSSSGAWTSTPPRRCSHPPRPHA